MILTVRTDKPEAEVGLYDGETELAYKKWQAHRELSVTLHKTVLELLKSLDKDWKDIKGIVFYEGPGSFTGLRIGAAFANALAYANDVPLTQQNGEDWIKKGLNALKKGQHEAAIPRYGAEANTTPPRK